MTSMDEEKKIKLLKATLRPHHTECPSCSCYTYEDTRRPTIDLKSLADNAIVMGAELEHINRGGRFYTSGEAPDGSIEIWLQGHQGIPGKNLVIIVPLKE